MLRAGFGTREGLNNYGGGKSVKPGINRKSRLVSVVVAEVLEASGDSLPSPKVFPARH